jgi:hypothetical protein
MGWWFGRILTFEILADETPPAIGQILGDASRGAIVCGVEQSVVGYAAYGRSIRAAIEPLVSCYGVELFDDGSTVRTPFGEAALVHDDELGNSAHNAPAPRVQRERLPARDVPAVLRLSYYDAARDFQAGEARANASEQTGNEEQRELPAVVDAAGAKALAQQALARVWAEREKLTLRLPPRYLGLEPGSRLGLELDPTQWTVEKCTIDGFVVVAELRPTRMSASMPMVAAVSSTTFSVATAPEVVSISLFDVPDVFDLASNEPVLLMAASSPASGWRRRTVELRFADQAITTATAHRKSILGRALTALPPGEPYLIDATSSVDVELVDPDQWLTACDDPGLVQGRNLAVLGNELIQFGDASPLGEGCFRLQRLLRGRGGTEWASSLHQIGDSFALIEPGSLQPIRLPRWVRRSAVAASVIGSGEAADVILSAESLRPLAPAGLRATVLGNGDVELRWTRRSRSGWAWLDEVDVPIGEEREEYSVTLTGAAGSAEFTSRDPQLTIAADQLTAAGPGLATVQVRQIGDWAASRPAELALILP